MKKNKQEFTGPDYLIGAAQHLMETPVQYTDDAQERTEILSSIASFQDFIIGRVKEGRGFPRGADLTPREVALVMVLREAIGVSVQRKDRKSLEELLSWGSGVMVEFLRASPFGRREPQLTPADTLMAVLERGRQQGIPDIETFQSLLRSLAGVPDQAGREIETDLLAYLIALPLMQHEEAAVWIVSELVRAAVLKRDFEGLTDAVGLAVRLGFKSEAYLRGTGRTVFSDVRPWDVGRGQSYREFKPLPGAVPLDIGEEFIALGEWFRRARGSYGISSEFIRTLEQQFANGEYRPPPTLAVRTAITYPDQLPDPPVARWSRCPNCSGVLKAVERVAECLSCRHFWCDPHDSPRLDDSGKLTGADARLPDDPFYDSVAVYIRGPRTLPPPLPD